MMRMPRLTLGSGIFDDPDGGERGIGSPQSLSCSSFLGWFWVLCWEQW